MHANYAPPLNNLTNVTINPAHVKVTASVGMNSVIKWIVDQILIATVTVIIAELEDSFEGCESLLPKGPWVRFDNIVGLFLRQAHRSCR